MSFSYPCDWLTDVTGKPTFSEAGTVVSPDGKASFYYPAPDMGNLERAVETGRVTVNGKEYVTDTWESNNETLTFVRMGTDLSQYEYDLMFAGSWTNDEMNTLLESFSF